MLTRVLIDTTVWSLSLRRRAGTLSGQQDADVRHLHELSRMRRACLIGPVRQEVLTGIRSTIQFASVQDALLGIPDLAMPLELFDTAAACANRCIGRGIAIDDIDLMLCAAAILYGVQIWTSDGDFARYASVLDELPPLYQAPAATEV